MTFRAFGAKRKTLTPCKTLTPRLDPDCAKQIGSMRRLTPCDNHCGEDSTISREKKAQI